MVNLFFPKLFTPHQLKLRCPVLERMAGVVVTTGFIYNDALPPGSGFFSSQKIPECYFYM